MGLKDGTFLAYSHPKQFYSKPLAPTERETYRSVVEVFWGSNRWGVGHFRRYDYFEKWGKVI